MLSITQFPRRFPTIRKRAYLPALATMAPSASGSSTGISVGAPLAASVTTLASRDVTFNSIHSLQRASIATRGVQTKASSTPSPLSPTPKGSAQSFATSVSALEDDEGDDSYLYGERDDDWFTTSRNPRRDPTFPGKDPVTGRLSSIAMPNLKTCTREEILDYFDNTWAITDALFETLQGEHAFTTPPPHQLRHPLIFYYGHPTVFFVNKFRVSGLLTEPVNAYFEQVFEVGVDEMRWDDMSKNEMEWPSVAEATEYRRKVYGIIREIIETHPGLAPGHAQIDESSQLWALCMALEHERIHIETSSMLMLEHPVEFFQPSKLLADYHESAYRADPAKRPVAGVDYPVNELLPVAGGRVQVGKPRDFPTFGWDNEYGTKEITVPSCEASKFMISNGEFWEFVSSGGYLEPSYWSQLGWEWRCFRNTKWPQFWQPDGPSGSHQYNLRALFDVIPMQWDWPAQVNFHEAQAFCKWKNERDGNKDSVVYHITTEGVHQLMRDAKDRSASTESDDVLEVQTTMAKEHGKNLNFSYASFAPVDAMKPTASGFHDVFGNAWEWCEDMFSALPGFKLHKYYDDFSAPCFDGEHHVIMGGSFISMGDNGASKYARYHFRPHFFQHAGFRLVAQPVDQETQSYTLATTCVNAPGPYVNTNPYRSSDVVSLNTNGSATKSASAVDVDALFDDVYRKSESALERFIQSLAQDNEAQTILVRNGVDGARKLKNQLKQGDMMVVVANEQQTPLVGELSDEYSLVQSGVVPVFTKESATSARISVQNATAWKKN
ncbi:hypothetical protein Poli38472_012461 [Pythium oligandrum]|uniref:Sulfatase-modifying factor enzyme-like domain-containing protein n=1 Tax=Pythium oligandrum TaxID=41045 RepID=A0A8K1CPX1_PYTOL|nr:hypothetical protein Poli38472_012461 [Pythium oligandrum]|eukprot:TMW67345.1 hypothetical protein Poli38472_012461 [Pythium oligandrum]